MNQKNSLGIDICFQDLNNPIELFRNWREDAKKSEPDDPNALALATADKKGIYRISFVDFVNSKDSNKLKGTFN